MKSYVVATTKPWDVENFHSIRKEVAGDWHLVSTRDDLTLQRLRLLQPRYVFFPHWSWLIPDDVHCNFECVVFHMSDVPFGRGGSPLQNLIERGVIDTKISALRVTKDLDGGPVYLKEPFTLLGGAEELYIRASQVVFGMMRRIVHTEPQATPQEGTPVVFKRRKPEDSRIPDVPSLDKVFDWIRMLDAEGYPAAFIETEYLRIELSRASRKRGRVLADARITLKRSE